MGGQAGARGYLVQALIAVLDSLNEQDKWTSVTIEPSDESEKVDIVWRYDSYSKKVVQVKSTQNSFYFREAKKWANELENKTSDATEYLLLLVGRVKDDLFSKLNTPIGKVSLRNIELDIDNLNAQIVNKIDEFFEKRNKSHLSTDVKTIITKCLSYDFTENSIYGKEFSRNDFDNRLLGYLSEIEESIKRNPYTALIKPSEPDKDFGDKYNLTKNILNLIGWNKLNEEEKIVIHNTKTDQDDIFHVDFYASYDSRLKDNEFDNIYINSFFDIQYPVSPKNIVSENTLSANLIHEQFKEKGKYDKNVYSNHNIQFFLSLKESELNQHYINNVRRFYRSNILQDDITYYVVDNIHLNFLISSIISAKSYRDSEKLAVKFLYPITEDNSSERKIGKRGTSLPPQYINTSILPIIKENHEKISLLLYCADSYSKERLKKLIWLLIRLTSGFANEYRIYFSDYSSSMINEVNEVIRSYNDEQLIKKLEVDRFNIVESSKLKDIPIIENNSQLIDEEFNSVIEEKKIVKINPHLVEFLPYGDLIRPFLNSEFIQTQDLKTFLSQKGIFLKGNNKINITHLMTSLLFSPAEIEKLVELVCVKDKPMAGSDQSYPLLTEHSISAIMKNNSFNFSGIEENLNASLLSEIELKPSKENPNIYVWEGLLDHENPTKQAMVSHSISKARITVKKENNNFVTNKEYNSAAARVLVNRIEKIIKDKLVNNNIIEEKVKEVLFAEFENKERVNFLLSFTNVEDTNIFDDPTATSVLYSFDENKNIPEEHKDKIGREFTQRSSGRNLEGIKEITEDAFKEIIFLEAINISYRFNWRGIYGYYNVKLNFSHALRNKPIPNGCFQFQPDVRIGKRSKEKVTSMQTLEQELKKEFSKMRMNRYKQFNKI